MKKIFISLGVAALLTTTMVAKTSQEVAKDAFKQAKIDAYQNKAKLIDNAVQAVALTQQVLFDLSKKDVRQATKDLERAIGKLEITLSAENAPKYLPVSSKVSAIEFVGSASDVKKAVETVKDLLEDGKVQEARKLLDTLQDQINISTVSLPVSSYPDALKLAAKYLHEGKVEEAKSTLVTALHTLVEDVVIVPIPLLQADSLIKNAQKIAKKDKKQALKHLALAQDELDKAKALGYVSKSDITYKTLREAIKKVEKEIKGKNKAEKLFEDLINKLKSFKDKIVK